MKAFITGITGFAGSFLAENLLASGKYDVSGTYLSENSLINVDSVKDRIKLYRLDLQDFEAVKGVILEEKPDVVFHLAALASPAKSIGDARHYILNNISVQLNLQDAVREAELNPTILIVSSAGVYGSDVADYGKLDENAPLNPADPYAFSKLAQDFLGLQYFLTYKIPIIRVRPFNHIGPRQSLDFAVASFAKKIADIESGKNDPILKVGNLEAKRDFTDVRDMVQAYVDLIEKGVAGDVYNAGSGKSITMREVLDKLLAFSTKDIKVEIDQSLFRPVDIPELVCDNTKLVQTTGWQPKIEIDQTLKDTLEYFRNQE